MRSKVGSISCWLCIASICLLLSTFSLCLGSETENTDDHDDHGDSHSYTVHVSYDDIYKVLVFFVAVYAAGKISSSLGMPSLVGEIIVGTLLGPPFAEFVPYEEALVLIGEIGLIALILEAGIELDVAQLRQTGTRAMAIAFTGSFLPVGVGMAIAIAFGNDVKAALAIGAAFAPTSLGVAASALNSGGMINTPVGQLIIASCVVDDIIGLILLSMFQVLVKPDPSIIEYLIPIISSFGFLLVLGLPAITFLPELIKTKFLPMFPKKHRSLAMFGLLTAMCMAYIPMLNETKSSYLTGAFLAGATFSQIDGAYDKFMHSSHHVMEWLLRVFFAASIGFQVPLREFQKPAVIGMGFLFWGTCVTVKALVAFYVPNFENADKGAIYDPHKRDFIVTGLSMTCRGEFSFIIAAFALSEGLIEADMYASVVFAVLLSAISSPFMLLKCIAHFNKLKKKHLDATKPPGDGPDSGTMSLHFRIYIESKNTWGLMEYFQKEINKLDLVIVDYRTYHNRGSNPSIANDIYVRDKKRRCAIPSVRNLMKSMSLASSMHTRGISADEADPEVLKISQDQYAVDKQVMIRAKSIQKSLYNNLDTISISELAVEQWNPWDWTSALDAMVLKRGSGREASMDFFMEVFDKADLDGSGDIDADELSGALEDVGMKVIRDNIDHMIAHVDEDGDGEISRDEWRDTVAHYLEKKKMSVRIDLASLESKSGSSLVVKSGSNDSTSDRGKGDISFPVKDDNSSDPTGTEDEKANFIIG